MSRPMTKGVQLHQSIYRQYKLGMPYMGSKRKLSKKIVDEILNANPNTKYIYDLFGGGGAISFEAMQRPTKLPKIFTVTKNIKI